MNATSAASSCSAPVMANARSNTASASVRSARFGRTSTPCTPAKRCIQVAHDAIHVDVRFCFQRDRRDRRIVPVLPVQIERHHHDTLAGRVVAVDARDRKCVRSAIGSTT